MKKIWSDKEQTIESCILQEENQRDGMFEEISHLVFCKRRKDQKRLN